MYVCVYEREREGDPERDEEIEPKERKKTKKSGGNYDAPPPTTKSERHLSTKSSSSLK